MEEKSAKFCRISLGPGRQAGLVDRPSRGEGVPILIERMQDAIRLQGWPLILESRARVRLNALEHAAKSRFKFLSTA